MSSAVPHPAVDDPSLARRRATLCITTFLRPVGLSEALDAVAAMRVPASWDLDIVVVDNDAHGSARAIVDDAIARGADIRYVIEPERGLSHVRNRACAEASRSDWLLFLDDDEAPNADWLERIDAAQRRSDADVTIGPSVPVYETTPPKWVVKGGYFERERFPTGATIPYWHARTSGVLIRRAAFDHLGDAPFDPDLALIGGEDRNFFAAIAGNGGTFVWADDAIVRERVPASRMTLGWVLRRAFRTGNSRTVTLLRMERPGLARRAKRLGRGLYDIASGILALVTARSANQRVRGLQRVATGCGLALGVVGYRYAEYKTVHGT